MFYPRFVGYGTQTAKNSTQTCRTALVRFAQNRTRFERQGCGCYKGVILGAILAIFAKIGFPQATTAPEFGAPQFSAIYQPAASIL